MTMHITLVENCSIKRRCVAIASCRSCSDMCEDLYLWFFERSRAWQTSPVKILFSIIVSEKPLQTRPTRFQIQGKTENVEKGKRNEKWKKCMYIYIHFHQAVLHVFIVVTVSFFKIGRSRMHEIDIGENKVFVCVCFAFIFLLFLSWIFIISFFSVQEKSLYTHTHTEVEKRN